MAGVGKNNTPVMKCQGLCKRKQWIELITLQVTQDMGIQLI